MPQADGSVAEFITCQFPVNLGAGEAEVIVKVNNTALPAVRVTLQSYAPSIAEFFSADGRKLGSFIHRNSGDIVTVGSPATPGEIVLTYANGMGPTDPSVSEGHVAASPAPRTLNIPEIRINGQTVEVTNSTMRLGYVGVYEVAFRVPANITTGEHNVRMSVGGVASNEVRMPSASTSGPVINAIVSSANFKPGAPIAPGSIVSLFATNIGGTNTNLFPATNLGALSVRFNGTPAPLFAVVPEAGQINVLVPLRTLGSRAGRRFDQHLRGRERTLFDPDDIGESRDFPSYRSSNPSNQFAAAMYT